MNTPYFQIPQKVIAVAIGIASLFAGCSTHASLLPGWDMTLNTNIPSEIDDIWLAENGGNEDEYNLFAVTTGAEVTITDEIRDLARALENDPLRIFMYVRDHIQYEPTYGQRKGALGTLLSGRGNDLDQSALLIALLNAADPASNARFVRAQVDYTQAFLGNLIDVPTNKALLTLSNLGLPVSSAGSNVRVVHFWVEATINGQVRVLDPAFVASERVAGVSLSSLVGYDRSNFLARASVGATNTADYIQNVNYANITNDLRALVTNTLAGIRANYATASIGEFLGESRSVESPITGLPTNLPHIVQIVGGTRLEYTEIPSNLHARVTINHRGIVRSLKACEIAAKRLSITYVGANNQATLKINGVTDTTGTNTTIGTKYDCTITMTTPYTSGTLSGAHTHKLLSGGNYAVLAEFGVVSPRVIQHFRKQLSRDRANGASDTSETVLCGSLHIIGLTYAHESRLSAYLAGKAMGALGDYLLSGGIVSQESSFGIDLAINTYRGYFLTSSSDDIFAAYRSAGLMMSAFEHTVYEQAQGSDKPAASTVKLLWKGNASGHRTYMADSANWSTVQAQLQGYTTSTISSISGWISAGFKVMLPRRGDHAIGDWLGAGYLVYFAGSSLSTGYIISGDLNGGAGGYTGNVNVNTVLKSVNLTIPTTGVEYKPTLGADPVDLFTGDFVHSRDLLALGSVPPEGVGLSSDYNSGQSDQSGVLGHGWRHNLDMAATLISSPDPSGGLRQPADAVPLIVRSMVVGDILKHELNLKGYLVSTLVSQWQSERMVDNSVVVRMGNRTLEFIRMPDGSYIPPPGITSRLIQTNGQYRMLERYGREYRFNTNGTIHSIVNADGKSLSFTYNSQTNVQNVTDAYGRALTFSYSTNKVSSVSDGTGRSVTFGYTSNNLTTITDPEGKAWTYRYNSNRLVVAMLDPLNQVIVSNIYNAVGQVITQRNGNADTWVFHTSGPWGLEIGPKGDKTTHFFDRRGNNLGVQDPLDHRSYNFYNGQGRVVSNRNARGFVTVLQYDTHHNVTGRVDALNHVHSFTYDAEHRLITEVNPLGHTIRYGYDSAHHLTNMIDALSNETVRTYYTSGTHKGLLHIMTEPGGRTTTFTYDSFGNPATINRTDGGVETRTWNERGDVLTLADANTNTTTYTWDKRRLQTSVRDPYGGTISNIYDGAGMLVTNINQRGGVTIQTWTPTYQVRTIKYPDNGIVSNTYDAADRLVLVRNQIGGITSNQYDLAGRLIKVVNPLGHETLMSHDEAGNIVSVQNGAGHVVSNVYDALNRLVVTIDPLGYSATNEYDAIGRLIATVDQEGKRTEYEYDALGRLLLQTRSGLEYTFEYDVSGNRTAYINPKNERIGFGFDKMNRMVAETNAVGKVTRYAYDLAGNLIRYTDAQNRITTNSYDKLNRLVLVSYPNASTVAYQYDSAGNLTNMVDGIGTTRQSFDAMNQLIRAVDPFGLTITNQYDLAGRRTHLVYPGGNVQQFSYDARHRLTNVSASAFGVSSVSYAFDNMDNLTGIVRPGGITSSFSNDPLHRIVAYSASNGTSNFIQRALTRNALGFKTAEQIAAGLEVLTASSTQAHQHDAADRITSVTHTNPVMTVTPWFDANGNVTQVVQVIQTLAGNISFTNRYEYDFDNRLVAVVSPTLVAQYVYDGLGNLLQITEAGTVRRFVRDRVDSLARPIAELSGSNTLVRSYLWANGSLIAQVETGGAMRYAHFNESGHLLALTDGSGNVTDKFSYHPYGRLVARTGNTETHFAYMGAYGVMRSGYDLYLTRHRAYSGNLMRFMQTDPLGLDGGLNLYAYAGGNPLYWIDPLGLARESSGGTYHPGYISSTTMRQQNEVSSTWGTSIGFGGTMTPDMMRSVSLDWAMAIPTAVVGGLVDDAVRTAITAVRGGGSAMAGNSMQIGYHATAPNNANSILSTGFRESQAGRLGGGGVYVNNSPQGAVAEYMAHNPGGALPSVLPVRYNPGVNYQISLPTTPTTTGPLPLAADSLTAPSIRLPGTYNTIIRNGTAVPIQP